MNHALIGASIPFLIGVVCYIAHDCRASLRLLVITPAAIVICAVLAIVPDLPRAAGWYELYDRWSRDPRMNIFFGHYAIDQVEGFSPLYNIGFVLILLFLLLAARRELRILEGD